MVSKFEDVGFVVVDVEGVEEVDVVGEGLVNGWRGFFSGEFFGHLLFGLL